MQFITVLHLDQRRQKHIRIVAMDDDLYRIVGIEMRHGQIRFLPSVRHLDELTIVEIPSGEQIDFDVVLIGTFVIDHPGARTDRDVPIGGWSYRGDLVTWSEDGQRH